MPWQTGVLAVTASMPGQTGVLAFGREASQQQQCPFSRTSVPPSTSLGFSKMGTATLAISKAGSATLSAAWPLQALSHARDPPSFRLQGSFARSAQGAWCTRGMAGTWARRSRPLLQPCPVPVTRMSARGRGSLARASGEPGPSRTGFEGEDGGPLSRALALGSISSAVVLFLFVRLAGAEPSLSLLAAEAVPYDLAMQDVSRPAMVEFYADWCEVCREMARDVRKVETRFKDKVNFVMINVDDPRFVEELDEFGVDGIPHFVFLDKDKNEQGFVVGRMPRRILSENLTALANGEAAVPHSQLLGAYSESPDGGVNSGSFQALSEEGSSDVLPDKDEDLMAEAEAPSTSRGSFQEDSALVGLGPGPTSPPFSPSASPSTVTSSPVPVASVAASAPEEAASLYDFEVEDIKGERVKLEKYRGKVSLVVNVASKCGLTDSNYKGLTQLYSKYKDEGFEILAFPCNQFLGQEPGSNEQIEEFACSRYKATYPLFSKIDVNGPRTAPVYQFLKKEQGDGASISWNFEKFLVDRDGNVIKRFAPTFPPLSIEEDLKALL